MLYRRRRRLLAPPLGELAREERVRLRGLQYAVRHQKISGEYVLPTRPSPTSLALGHLSQGRGKGAVLILILPRKYKKPSPIWDESITLRGATQFRQNFCPFYPRLVGMTCDFSPLALYARSENVLPTAFCAGFQPPARSLETKSSVVLLFHPCVRVILAQKGSIVN